MSCVLSNADTNGHGYEAMASSLPVFRGTSLATSDLCVRDLVFASRFPATTAIFAESNEDAYSGFAEAPLPGAQYLATVTRANHVARLVRRERPDIIIAQQYLPTAAAIAKRLPHAKVILYRHNLQKSHRSGTSLREFFSLAAAKRRNSRLAGLIHFSQPRADAFAAAWPEIAAPGCAVNNGLHLDACNPAPERPNEVLCINCCAPEKGIPEAAQATAAVFPAFPQWGANSIVSNISDHPIFTRQTQGVPSGTGARALLEVQRPFAEIKAAAERVAIAPVPSCWVAPRLRRMSGGAVLIPSGRGGFAEVSGETALMLPAVTAETIAAVIMLITDAVLRVRQGINYSPGAGLGHAGCRACVGRPWTQSQALRKRSSLT